MATADLTVIGLGRADASASRYIAEIQRRLAAQDRVRFQLHAMGTSLEGETGDILALVGELHAVPFELGLPRVYSVLKLDERRDKAQTLEDKVASVQRLLEAGRMSDDDRSRAAAAEVVAGWVEPETTIGLGSGRGVRAVIAALGERWPDGVPLRAAVASRSSDAAAREVGIEIVGLTPDIEIAMVIDGSDEIDPDLQLLKGGGGALLHEKVLCNAGGGLVVVAEAEKHTERLGVRYPLPIEIVRFGWEITAQRVAAVLDTPVLRTDAGEPFVTEEGHLLLDTPLGPVDDLHALAVSLWAIPGVVEHGLFLDCARAVVLGRPDGTTEILGQRP